MQGERRSRWARLQRHAVALALASALAGAVVLLMAAITVVISVVLRSTTGGQILGDFEIMSTASALAVFLFLPYCQATRSHVSVSLFTDWLPANARSWFDAFWWLVLALGAAFMAWRMSFGLGEALHYNDHSAILHIPAAIAFAFAIFGSVAMAAIAAIDFVGLALRSIRAGDPPAEETTT